MRHVQALLNWILLSTWKTDLKRIVVEVVVDGKNHIRKHLSPRMITDVEMHVLVL